MRSCGLGGISFSVEPGRIFGLLRANGAGKTTCMRIVLDNLRADLGRVTWDGGEYTALPGRTWDYLLEEGGPVGLRNVWRATRVSR